MSNVRAVIDSYRGGDIKKALESLAQHAEDAEKYEDMCEFLKELINVTNGVLDQDQRNLLSIAFKNHIGNGRNAHRALSEEDGKEAQRYKELVSARVVAQCDEIISLLTDKLIPVCGDSADSVPVFVFYTKMAGDYNRYAAEIEPSDEKRNHYKSKAAEFYGAAWTKAILPTAEGGLNSYDPIRLGLALNYSVCHYEILDQKEEAKDLAKRAFDEAIQNISNLEQEHYKDATLIMQLLRDNLTLWTSADGDQED